MPRLQRLLALLGCLMASALAVDRSKFRTCQDTLFCRSFRHPPAGHFAIVPGSLLADEAQGLIRGSLTEDLHLSLQALANGVVRVRISEVKDGERWKPLDILLPGAFAAAPIVQLDPDSPKIPSSLHSDSFTAYLLKDAGHEESQLVLVVHQSPLVIELFKDNLLLTTINSRSLMHYEKTQDTRHISDTQDQEIADRHKGKEVVDYGEDGMRCSLVNFLIIYVRPRDLR